MIICWYDLRDVRRKHIDEVLLDKTTQTQRELHAPQTVYGKEKCTGAVYSDVIEHVREDIDELSTLTKVRGKFFNEALSSARYAT